MGRKIKMNIVCPSSAATREDLERRGIDFVEYDVEHDREAHERMLELTDSNRTVPVLVEEGKPVQVGIIDQGCLIQRPPAATRTPPRYVYKTFIETKG